MQDFQESYILFDHPAEKWTLCLHIYSLSLSLSLSLLQSCALLLLLLLLLFHTWMNVVNFRFFAPSSEGDGESIPANTRASEASADLCESLATKASSRAWRSNLLHCGGLTDASFSSVYRSATVVGEFGRFFWGNSVFRQKPATFVRVSVHCPPFFF
jgi:hypothetical protein